MRNRQLDRIEEKLDRLSRSVHERLSTIERGIRHVATDQATFDAALTAFTADLQAGLDAIAAKIAAAGSPVDLSAELQALTDAKATLDAAVAADTA